MTQQIVIDIPASLATLIPSMETFARLGAVLVFSGAFFVALFILSAFVGWLASDNPKKRQIRIDQEEHDHDELISSIFNFSSRLFHRAGGWLK